jgi:hypothetical protein
MLRSRRGGQIRCQPCMIKRLSNRSTPTPKRDALKKHALHANCESSKSPTRRALTNAVGKMQSARPAVMFGYIILAVGVAAVFVAGVVLGTALGLWWALSPRTTASPAHVHVPSAIGVGGSNINVEAINDDWSRRVFKQLASGRFLEIRY